MQEKVTSIADERLVRGVPNHPVPMAKSEQDYIRACLDAIERNFGVVAFPGMPFEAVPARVLMRQMMLWWRGLDPVSTEQHKAHHDLPGAMMLLDFVCAAASDWVKERAEVRL